MIHLVGKKHGTYIDTQHDTAERSKSLAFKPWKQQVCKLQVVCQPCAQNAPAEQLWIYKGRKYLSSVPAWPASPSLRLFYCQHYQYQHTDYFRSSIPTPSFVIIPSESSHNQNLQFWRVLHVKNPNPRVWHPRNDAARHLQIGEGQSRWTNWKSGACIVFY